MNGPANNAAEGKVVNNAKLTAGAAVLVVVDTRHKRLQRGDEQ